MRPDNLTEGLTAEQLEAVNASGKVLVAASAGSGKTTTMVARILSDAAAGIPLRRMLILVYNNAAADELKARLHDKLFECACLGDGQTRELFRRELDELGFADIGTIHGFCRSLIRENFEALGLSPDFEVLDERAHSVYVKRALDRVFADYAAAGDAVFDDIVEIFSRGRKEDNLRENVLKLHSLIEIQPDRSVFLERVEKCYASYDDSPFAELATEGIIRVLNACAAECEAVLPALEATGQRTYAENMRAISEAARVKPEGVLAVCAADLSLAPARKTAGADEDAVARAKNVQAVVKALFKTVAEDFADEDFLRAAHEQNKVYVGKLIEIALRFDTELKKLKQADGALSFADLESYAVELLKGEGRYADAYDAVYVDEYQDVNPSQEFIISRMTRGRVFTVGDVKQSIYGFRMADPDIFLKRLREYAEAGGCTAVSFLRNFRSEESILNFVNAVFGAVMTRDSCDVDYRREAAFLTESKRIGDNVQFHLFAPDRKEASDDENAGNADDIQAQFIASEIRKLIGRAKTPGGIISYGDIAVLFRNRNSASQKTVEALARAGIPTDAGSFVRKRTLPERDLITFLTVLDNPRQDIPLGGFLLSYFGGYDEDDAAEIAAARPEGGDLYDAVLAVARREDELGQKLRETLRILDNYRTKASFKSVHDLMQTIVSDFSYDAYLASKGEASAESLIAFITADAGERRQGLGKFLEAYRGAENAERRTSGGDKVRISTFHGFKGLEAPVVFVADIGSPFSVKGRSGDLIADTSGNVGLSYFDLAKRTKAKTLSRLAVERAIKARETKEEMRLFYVALTRAQQYLYVTAAIGETRLENFGRLPCLDAYSSNLDFVSQAFFEGSPDVRVFAHRSPATAEVKAGAVSLAGASEEDIAAIERGRSFVYPFRDATEFSMKYAVSAVDGGDEPVPSVFADRAAEGTAYHKVMELIDFDAVTPEAVEAEIAAMTAAGKLSADEAAAVDATKIAACLLTPLMRAAAKCPVMRERSFMMYVPAREVFDDSSSADKVLVQGVVDLIIDGEERIIVDFKNSALNNAEALNRYKKQLKLYKTATEHAFMEKIDRVMLYSFVTGSFLEL